MLDAPEAIAVLTFREFVARSFCCQGFWTGYGCLAAAARRSRRDLDAPKGRNRTFMSVQNAW
jgi:hypothetical protein